MLGNKWGSCGPERPVSLFKPGHSWQWQRTKADHAHVANAGLANVSGDVREDKVRFAFEIFDLDNSGFIEVHELRKIVKATNLASEKQLDRKVRWLLSQCDIDGDGQIRFAESMRCWAARPDLRCPQLPGVPRPRKEVPELAVSSACHGKSLRCCLADALRHARAGVQLGRRCAKCRRRARRTRHCAAICLTMRWQRALFSRLSRARGSRSWLVHGTDVYA